MVWPTIGSRTTDEQNTTYQAEYKRFNPFVVAVACSNHSARTVRYDVGRWQNTRD